MTEKTLLKYKSRRNSARLVQTDAGRYVKKSFAAEEGFHRELQIYRMLRGSRLPCARVIMACDQTLLLTEIPGRNLVDCLEQQERKGSASWDVWEKLVDWLVAFQRVTGFVVTDGNLRNFLYDDQTRTLYGLDFEECSESSILISAASVTAHIRSYYPENTQLKQEISKFVLHRFAQACDLEPDVLFRTSKQQETVLLERRKNRI